MAEKKEKKSGDAETLEKRVTRCEYLLRKLCVEAEKFFKKDFNEDGVIGEIKSGRTSIRMVVVALLILVGLAIAGQYMSSW